MPSSLPHSTSDRVATSALSRRDFIRKSVLAAAVAPWIVPAGVVRAQDGRPTPSNRTTFALIGCGNMGPAGLNAVIGLKTVQVVGTCDVFKSRATNWRNRVDKHYKAKGCTAYQDFRELLARKDIDSVEIATGDYWHVPIALYAVRAGKDVYVEKPLGVSVEWAKVLRKEINERKRIFQFGTWQRSRPHFRRVVELVRSGAIGKITRVEVWAPSLAAMDNGRLGGIFNKKSRIFALHTDKSTPPVPQDLDYDLWLGPAPKRPYNAIRVSEQGIYHNYDYALGFLAGWGIHPLDIAQWGLDADLAPPISYKAKGRLSEVPGLFDTVADWDVEATYANGINLHFMDSSVAAGVASKYLNKRHVGGEGTTFFGEKGWINVNRGTVRSSIPELAKIAQARGGQSWPPAGGSVKDSDRVTVKLHAAENGSHWHNFIARVRDRKPTLNPIESAFNGDLICHLANASIRAGRSLKWDPKTETIIDDVGAQAMLDRPLRDPWKI
ncbi:MAG: Gfo/Idh/MocA family oxidoreductase [Puniceicoccales bacterium]|nr:Gfo/Idh/MocA family oxidoreductase [Puniceicoccales bacterium]